MKRSAVFQFRSGNSFFHRLDPLTKLVWLVGVSLMAFGAYIGAVQVAITLAVFLTALVLARLSLVEIWRGTWLFGLACVSFLIVQTLTLPGSRIIFHLAGRPVYAESFDYALASALRIYAIILSSLVFVRTTDPRDLAIALVTQMKVPYRIAYAFFIALRIVPTVEQEIKTIRAAQSVRGVVRQGGVAGQIGEMKRYSNAAAGREPAEGLDDGALHGGSGVWGLSAPHLRRRAAHVRSRRRGLRPDPCRCGGLVYGAGRGPRAYHVCARSALTFRAP